MRAARGRTIHARARPAVAPFPSYDSAARPHGGPAELPVMRAFLRFVVSLALAMACAAIPSPRASAQERSLSLEDVGAPTGPWQIALGLALGVADYGGHGIGIENRWSGGVAIGAGYRVARRTVVGLDLEARFLGMDDEELFVPTEIGERLENGAVYSFVPMLRLSQGVALRTSPLALAFTARAGGIAERYVEPTLRSFVSGPEPVTERAGPRRRGGPLVGLAAGLDFRIGDKGSARLEVGWTMAYFPREVGDVFVTTPAGARHEATFRFSLLYDVPRRGE